MASKHMERCSISLVAREMQNKTTVRGHLISPDWQKFKNLKNLSIGKVV